MWTSLGQEGTVSLHPVIVYSSSNAYPAPMNPVLSPQQASWRHVLLPEESLLFDRERLEQENRDSSVYGDDLGHEQIVDHDGDTEPLLREWFAERERELLSGTYEDSLDDDDDSGYDDESLLSGTTLVDGDWPSSDDSGYESAGSSDDGHVNSFGSDPSGD